MFAFPGPLPARRGACRVIALVMLLAARVAAAAGRPDIIVLMADDLDEATLWDARDLGLMPNLDASLRAGGLRFDESFVSDPLCCPSRATFLTGQYPHNHGVLNITYNASVPEGSFAAFDDREHLGVWLQRAGYRTGLIGKFLNGYGYVPPRNCPACDRMRYVPPGWNDWQGMPDYGELNGSAGIGYAGAYCMYNYSINVNGTLVTYHGATGDYQTDVIAQRALAFVDQAATSGQPFFLYLAPLAPHYELCLPAASGFEWDVRPPPRYADTLPPSIRLDRFKPSYDETDVGDKPSWFAATYPPLTTANMDALDRQYRHRIEALRALDDLIGALRQRLVARGTWNDTVFVFTSDNGWLYGEHRTVGKVLAYEESIRVPLLLRGPGMPANLVRHAPALNNDLAPTLSELAGATPGLPMDGRSLLPLFGTDSVPGWRRRFLVEHHRDFAGAPVAYADYLAVRTTDAEAAAQGGPRRLWVDWRLDRQPQGIEHYDITADPYQIESRSGGDVAALRTSLALLRDCGKPGRASCRVAEFSADEIHLDGFD